MFNSMIYDFLKECMNKCKKFFLIPHYGGNMILVSIREKGIHMVKIFLFLGSISAFLAVSLGAFGAHVLKGRLSSDLFAVYQTGVHYHLIHSLALILIAIIADKIRYSILVPGAGWLMTAGIVLFSGSLYALSMTGLRNLGIITPFGGVAFLLGWLCLAIAAVRWL